MNRMHLILSAILFSGISAFARISPDMHFTHLDTKDGLTIGSVTSLCFDKYGMVWVGTGYGLNSYDGTSVIQHVHADRSNSILKLCTDGEDNLFVACNGELYRRDLRTGRCTTILSRTSRAIAWREKLYVADKARLLAIAKDSSLTKVFALQDEGDVITALAVPHSDSSIWLGTRKGDVIRIDGNEVSCWNAGSYIESLYMTTEGDMFIATMSHGLSKVNSGEMLSCFRGKLSSPFVRCMCEDDDGNLWVGTYLGLDCIEKDSGQVISFKPQHDRTDAISHSSIWSINKDAQGTLWVGTFFGGINILNPSYEIYRRYPVGPDGLSSPVIGKIQETRGNLVLIATEGGGLNVYDRTTGANKVYSKGSPLGHISENNIKDFYYDRQANSVWLGTHLGGGKPYRP